MNDASAPDDSARATLSSAGDAPPLEPGLAFVSAARYAIGAEVGQGGMGRIFAARDLALGRSVALKLPRPGAEAQLRHEALITARLQHPGIIPVYEAGRLTSGQVFYAMRLVHGRPLDEVIAQAGSHAERLALLRHFIAAAEAVAYAHGEGVVHRDLKPQNVLVGALGETVVIDWGLARELEREPRDNVARVVAGTPAYMAPEQARGEPADRASDVFALGAMLFHLLSGRAPRAGTSTRAIRAAAAGVAPRLQALDPATPPDLLAIVDKAMAADAAARYPDARALAEDLERFERGQLVGAYRYGGGELLRRWLRRHRALVTLGAAALVALAVVVVLGVSGIASERDVAEAARAEAVATRDALLLAQARVWLDKDATVAFGWLREYAAGAAPDPAAIHATMAEARARGVARHVWLGLSAVAPARDGLSAALIDAGRIALLDIRRGAITPLSLDGGDVRGFVWAKDGSMFAAISEKRLRVFRPDSGTPMHLLELPEPARSAAFLADGSAVAVGGGSGLIRILPLAEGAPKILAGHEAAVKGVETSADGKYLLSTGNDGTARLWDLASGKDEVLPDSNAKGVGNAVLSPTLGRVAWSGPDLQVRWRALGGGPVTALAGHEGEITNVTFAPDGRSLLSGSFDHSVRVWDLATGEATVLAGHADVISRLLVAHDGRHVLSASIDRAVLVWDLATLDHRRLEGHAEALTAAAFARDGTSLVIGDGDYQLRVWDVPPSSERVLRGHTSASMSFLLLPGDRPLSLSDDGSARLWDLAGGAARVFPTPVTQLGGWTYSADKRRIAAGGVDASVWIMDSESGTSRVVGKHAGVVRALDFSPDGRRLASASADRTVKVWDLDGTSPPKSIGGFPAPLWSLVFAPDGQTLAVAGDERAVRLIDLKTSTVSARVGHRRRPTDLTFLPDGRLVSSGADNTLRIWEADGTARVLSGHEAAVTGVRKSPDGRLLASVSDDRSARLWDLADLDAGARVLPHDAPVTVVAFSADGRRVLTGAADGGVRIWDAASGHLLEVRREHGAAVSEIAVTADGRRFVSSSEDMTLRVDLMPTGDLAGGAAALEAVSSVRIDDPSAAGSGWHVRAMTPRR